MSLLIFLLEAISFQLGKTQVSETFGRTETNNTRRIRIRSATKLCSKYIHSKRKVESQNKSGKIFETHGKDTELAFSPRHCKKIFNHLNKTMIIMKIAV